MVQFGKKKNAKEESPYQGCGMHPGMTNAEALKQLKEMEKNKAKSQDCPYIDKCTFKMIPIIGKILCLDQEDGMQSQAYMVHMAGHHMWESCKEYINILRLDVGVLPKDLKKALKETKEK